MVLLGKTAAEGDEEAVPVVRVTDFLEWVYALHFM